MVFLIHTELRCTVNNTSDLEIFIYELVCYIHAGSDSDSFLLIQQTCQPFIVLWDISTPKSDVTVRQTLWNVWLHALSLYKPVCPVNDLIRNYTCNEHVPIWFMADTYPDLLKKPINIDSVIFWLWIFTMIFYLLILQGKPCWSYWNSNLIQLRTFGISSDSIIRNSKFTYFGLYTQAS